MFSVGRGAGRVIVWRDLIFNFAISSDTVNLMVLLFELCLFVPLSLTLTIFQGHSSIKHVNVMCSYPIKQRLHRIVKYVKYIMNTSPGLKSPTN